MTITDNIAVVHQFINEVLNHGRHDLLGDPWTNDLIWRGGSLGEVRGLDAYQHMLASNTRTAFTGMHLRIEQTVAQDNTVVLLFTNSGTHTGDFMGIKPTGRRAEWLGSGFYHLRDGKITEATFAEDILGLLQQLGATVA